MKRIGLLFVMLVVFELLFGQFVPVHVYNKPAYDFLEEMAAMKLVQVNTTVKPWSRQFVQERLIELDKKRDQLNNRQKEELDYLLMDYAKDSFERKENLRKNDVVDSSLLGFRFNDRISWNHNPSYRWDLLYYQDSLFSLRINPILGYQYWIRDDGESISHRWSMADAEATIGEHWSFYASYRDNKVDQILSKPEYFSLRYGAPYKRKTRPEYHESRGGIFYSWNWGSFGFAKDHFDWGTNYHGSNIFSAKHPSIVHINLKIKPAKWFEFNFVNGQLVSDMVDSTRSYFTTGGTYRTAVVEKYLSANMFTITPTSWLQFSVGNSVIYSDTYHWGYLIPLYFYKPVDHTLNSMYKTGQSGQNSQVFTEFVLRPLKKLQINGTIFIDELSVGRIGNPDFHNFASYKAGFMLVNFPFQNIQCFGEYTVTSPMTFQHNIESTTFETNSFNLGHYLRDNSQEFYGKLRYKPTAHLLFEAEVWLAQHGQDFIYGLDENPVSHRILETIIWEQKAIQFSASYKFWHSARIFSEVLYQSTTGNVEKFTPEFFHGKHLFITLGAHYGL